MAELLTEGSEAAVLLALPPCDHDVGDNDDEDDDYGDDIHHTYYDEEWVCLSEESSLSRIASRGGLQFVPRCFEKNFNK